MRFITEFTSDDGYGAPVPLKKYENENRLGHLIAETFGWEERGTTALDPKSPIKHVHKLEIEAFPMDKWIEFKQKLFMECGMPEPNGVAILEMIKDLEFYTNNKQAVDLLIGKPSGDAITNLADQMEYRGPNSHCKACEDEKNGVKHIMTQKHTCKK